MVVLVACLALTAAGVTTTMVLYRDSERQLLDQQTREAAAVLTSAIGEIETGLKNMAIVTVDTGGDPELFTSLADQMIANSGFVSISVLAADGRVVAAAGEPSLLLEAAPDRVAVVIDQAADRPGEIHVELVENGDRRLAYFTTAAVDGAALTVYAETPLPEQTTGVGRSDGPFSDVDYAIYLGAEIDVDALLYTSADGPTIEGERSVVTLPFADEGLVFVAAAARPLSGRFAQAAPWLLLGAGLLVSVLAGLATHSIIRRRQRAEELAAEISRLYEQQRAGIDTLRRSLLPRSLGAPRGCTIDSGYWPADADQEVSGDFYDAFQVSDDRWALVIGDVCGKGAEAAALTALTRHTIRAAARHLTSPTDVLQWTHEAIATHGASTYVTACFAFVEPHDDGSASVVLALGGHPRPALWRDGVVTMVGRGGTLLGLIEPQLESTVVELRPGDRLVFYTDGLTDSSDEPLTPAQLAEVIAEAIDRTEPGHAATAIQEAVGRRRPVASTDDSALLILQLDRVAADAATIGAAHATGPR